MKHRTLWLAVALAGTAGYAAHRASLGEVRGPEAVKRLYDRLAPAYDVTAWIFGPLGGSPSARKSRGPTRPTPRRHRRGPGLWHGYQPARPSPRGQRARPRPRNRPVGRHARTGATPSRAAQSISGHPHPRRHSQCATSSRRDRGPSVRIPRNGSRIRRLLSVRWPPNWLAPTAASPSAASGGHPLGLRGPSHSGVAPPHCSESPAPTRTFNPGDRYANTWTRSGSTPPPVVRSTSSSPKHHLQAATVNLRQENRDRGPHRVGFRGPASGPAATSLAAAGSRDPQRLRTGSEPCPPQVAF